VRKSDVIELLRDMPEEIDVDKLIYTLYFRRKIEVAEADAEAGREISHEEFEKLSNEWLTSG
jgi:hypothetical protein